MLPKIKTILYATGLGSGAPYIFRYAMTLALQHQASIVAVHAIEPLSTFGQSLVEQYISHEQSTEMHRQARESFKIKLNARIEKLLTEECTNAPECRKLVSDIRIVDGYSAQVILAAANDCAADLIIMGARRHSTIGEVMLGGTTRKVLHSADQPVLVVRVPSEYLTEG